MECKECPLGTYIPEGSMRGCTRKVQEECKARFEHMHDEVMPFLNQLTYDDKIAALQEAEDLELEACGSALGRYVDSKGKVK